MKCASPENNWKSLFWNEGKKPSSSFDFDRVAITKVRTNRIRSNHLWWRWSRQNLFHFFFLCYCFYGFQTCEHFFFFSSAGTRRYNLTLWSIHDFAHAQFAQFDRSIEHFLVRFVFFLCVFLPLSLGVRSTIVVCGRRMTKERWRKRSKMKWSGPVDTHAYIEMRKLMMIVDSLWPKQKFFTKIDFLFRLEILVD